MKKYQKAMYHLYLTFVWMIYWNLKKILNVFRFDNRYMVASYRVQSSFWLDEIYIYIAKNIPHLMLIKKKITQAQ